MSKYPALAFFKLIYGFLGYLVIGLGVLASLFVMMSPNGFLAGLLGIIMSLIGGATILMSSELLGLMMDVEQHLSIIRFNHENHNKSSNIRNSSSEGPRVPAPSVFKNGPRVSPKLGKFDPPSG